MMIVIYDRHILLVQVTGQVYSNITTVISYDALFHFTRLNAALDE